MDIPVRVNITATLGNRTIDEDAEIVASLEDEPDAYARLVAQMRARVPRYAKLTITSQELSARECEVYRLARRPADRLRALVGGRDDE